MSRDKDTALAVRCRMMADASTEALAWFAANEKFVGNRRAGLERGFKKHAVEARKLAQAAERPMSVGVFGASQAGKSFLTGSFISPADRPVHVVFGEGGQRQKLNFLNDVNPVGGDETTGLVTRFSIRPQSVPSNEYPVVLRLLSEADLVKIIANTYTLDLRGRGDKPLTAERVREVFAPLDAALAATALPGLADVDVFDIEQYIQEDLDDHPLNGHDAIREEYWLNLEKTAPYLQPRERAAALSVLWGEIPEFTELFLELKDALDSLGHPETGYAPLSAIRDRARGILHVATVYGLDLSDGDATARVTIMTPEGRTAALRKPVVTALTAELRVTMDSTPWPFFEHTDLLDFPGARGRESKTAAEFLRGEEAKPTNRAYCFLRGKIAVLFDKYSADLDLNTMLLCADDRNQEVRKLAELVQRWVARTHGRTAQDRAGKRTSMFLCLTKADTLFDQKAGAAPVDMIRTRIEKDIKFYASWTGEWMPGRPFDNTFFVRNPKFMREDLFDYEPIPPGADDGYVPAEIRLRETQQARLEDFTKVFAGIDVVRDHVARPEDKLSAVLEVNDGGITYLADALAPTCDPDQKYDQVLPRADGLAQRMARELAPFHEAGDVAERVAERAGRARAVMRVFARHPHLIGRFMAEISADEASLGGLYMKTARGGAARGEEAPAGPAPATGSGGIILDGLFDDEDDGTEPHAAAAPAGGGLAERYARDAVSYWIERLERKAADAELTAAYALSCEQFATVVAELSAGSRRFKLAEKIADAVRPIVQYVQRPDEQVHRVAMVTALAINNLVDDLGNYGREEGALTLPAAQPAMAPALPADGREMEQIRGRPLAVWLKALETLARDNAASTEGGLIDVEQNRILGEILAKAGAGAGAGTDG